MSSTPSPADRAKLERFVAAQAAVYPSVVGELTAGDKVSHWMWFIFPQLKALGYSETASFYGLVDLAEASAYLAHPLLGPRLVECCTIMRNHTDVGAEFVLGTIDAMKWRSCLTLFARVPDAPAIFSAMIEAFYADRLDERTLALLT